MYNGKVNLFVTFHWSPEIIEDNCAEIICLDFENPDAAVAAMHTIMPAALCTFDDGVDFREWNDEIKNGENPYLQITLYLNGYDNGPYFLAGFYPAE